MLPQTTLVANLVADGELRFSPTGKAVYKFRVAANDRRKDPNTGDWSDGPTTFLDCTAFGPRAEACADALHKGSKVIVVGKLQMREWNDAQTGAKRSAYEVLVDEVGLLVTSKPAARTATTPADDPWATVPPAAGGGYSDEPPF